MYIYTDDNNPEAFKILIAAKTAGVCLDKKIVQPNEQKLQEPKHLPYLKIDDENIIFSANAAVCYFLPPKEDVIEWLEWERVILAPILAHVIGGGGKNYQFKFNLTKTLTHLNKNVEYKSFLCGNSLNGGDIALFSILYPLYKDLNLAKEYLVDVPHVLTWIKHIEGLKQVREVLESFDQGAGPQQALLQGAKYPTPLPQNQVETAVSLQELKAAKAAWVRSTSHIPKLKKQNGVILPSKEERNILITSALPYVNNVPHLGNIIGCVLSADVFARFTRICNWTTLFIGGTDEYGTATETKALEEGISCREICDKYYAIHKDIYDWFNISFDYFGRSSAPQQTELCQDLFLQLNHNGFMFTESVEQLHCEKCNRYLADRFVEGGCPHLGCNYKDARGDQCDGCGKLVNATELRNPRCKICGSTPKLKTSKQFFIDLPKLEPLLLHWMEKSSPGWSSNAQIIGRSWMREGLKPRCITRDLKWGVPVPLDGFTDKVFYVWFDAPIAYMSISKAYSEKWENWWRPSKDVEVSLYQFMAKDNVPFHAVMFPACLLGTNRGYTTVSHIMATEYLNYEDGKFSKSRGVGVFGNDARDTGIPSDVWRFYLLYLRPESQDSSFSWADLATKINSELLNNLGNFINRALVFAKNNFNKTIPAIVPNKDDFILLALCTRVLRGYVSCLEKSKLRDGIRHILSISRHGNQYMQANRPWELLKGNTEEKVRAGTVVGICCNLACLLATLLNPYMPDTSKNLKKQLNAPNYALIPENLEITQLLPTGHSLGELSPLFTKLEPATVEELKQKFAGKNDIVDKPAGATNPSKTINVNITKTNGDDPKNLEEQITEQGLVVRKLKEGGANKSEWQPEVVKLLELKGKLAALLGTPLQQQTDKSKKKK